MIISPAKHTIQSEIEQVLSTYQTPEVTIDFAQFFASPKRDDIFIFPHEHKLYALIQRMSEMIESRGTLTWNKVGDYGKLTPQFEQMIFRVRDSHILHKLASLYFREFFLYEIPFYFIPIIRETFQPIKYGELKGDWRLIIHEQLSQHNTPLPFKIMTSNIRLRDYQQVALNCWETNGNFGTIELPTAAGKTYIAVQALFRLQQTTLIVVPTRTLIFQWKKDLVKLLNIPEKQIGVFYGSLKQLRPILIGTYNSLMKYILFTEEDKEAIYQQYGHTEKAERIIEKRIRYEQYIQNFYSFLILDESHHIPAPTFKRISLNSHALKRLGLSATVARRDGNESILLFSAGAVIAKLDYLELCKHGWVCSFLYRYVPNVLPESEIEKYKQYGPDSDAKQRMTFYNEQKLLQVLKIVKTHARKGHQILIFMSHVDAAYDLYENLCDLRIPSGLVISEQNLKKRMRIKQTREQIVNAFIEKKLRVIVTTTVLDEGFNVPDCCCGIIVSGTGSDRQLVQRIGRIIRKTNSDKIAYIYELCTEGNAEYFTCDQINRLMRNGMIDDPSEFRKDLEILTRSLWTYDYEIIARYVYELSKNRNVEILNPFS